MAYKTRKKSAGKSRTAYAARGTKRRSTRTTARRTRRPASGGTRTIRIVVEQAAPSAVQRPPLGMAAAPAPRKATF